MILYYGVVISVLFFGMLAQYVNSKSKLTQTSLSEGEVKYKNNYGIFYFLLFAVFCFFMNEFRNENVFCFQWVSRDLEDI